MPPQPGHHSPEHEPHFNTPREAVEWYRALGQTADLTGSAEILANAASLIEGSDLQPFLINSEGKVIKEIPTLLDAACLYAEAARVTSDVKTAKNYRSKARLLTKELYEDESRPPSTRLNARALDCDWQFADAYDEYVTGEIDDGMFAQRWTELQEQSLKVFGDTLKDYDSNEGDEEEAAQVYGRAGEWFFLNTHRHNQFKHEDFYKKDTGLEQMRLSFTREDATLKHPASANFDAIVEYFERESWVPAIKYQIKTRSGRGEVEVDCDADIEPRTINFPNMEQGFKIMLDDSGGMYGEMMSVFDDRISTKNLEPLVNDAFERVGILV